VRRVASEDLFNPSYFLRPFVITISTIHEAVPKRLRKNARCAYFDPKLSRLSPLLVQRLTNPAQAL
jgi:hypothetical protein